jgi:hypothetical protein
VTDLVAGEMLVEALGASSMTMGMAEPSTRVGLRRSSSHGGARHQAVVAWAATAKSMAMAKTTSCSGGAWGIL